MDLSDHVTKIGIGPKAESVDTTAMSALGWKTALGGLKTWDLSIGLQQDFASSKVYATLWPLLGTVAAIEVRYTNASVSATNPGFTGSVVITDLPILGSVSVGSLDAFDVSWTGTGALTPVTS